jgi:hypothetical protein
MQLFQILQLLDAQVVPQQCKVHLAVWNGQENPLDVYLAGQFDDWQSWQNGRNFERPLVVSLIALQRDNNWLFAGVHNSEGCEWLEERNMYRYRLSRCPGPNELDGRLIVRFERPGRQSYLRGENWSQAIEVAEIRPEKIRVAEFPGYSSTMLTKQHLDIVVRQAVESWRSALANVAGVYVIADRCTGKLYVGSATGGEGIWSRWCAYSETGHGDNAELIDLLQKEKDRYAENFQFGVLEIADTHATTDDVLRRESHWKDLLLSRVPHGYNAN